MPAPRPIPLDAALDADPTRPAMPPARARLAKALRVPRPTPDQIVYLERVQTAVSDYDPDTLIRGRRPWELPRD
jgi:hypothetical protein